MWHRNPMMHRNCKIYFLKETVQGIFRNPKIRLETTKTMFGCSTTSTLLYGSEYYWSSSERRKIRTWDVVIPNVENAITRKCKEVLYRTRMTNKLLSAAIIIIKLADEKIN